MEVERLLTIDPRPPCQLITRPLKTIMHPPLHTNRYLRRRKTTVLVQKGQLLLKKQQIIGTIITDEIAVAAPAMTLTKPQQMTPVPKR